MKLNSKNFRILLIGCIAVLTIGFFVLAADGLSALNHKSSQLVSLKAQSQQGENILTNLEQSKKDIGQYSYFKSVAKTVIPDDKNQAEAVLELNNMASQSGIALQSITFPNSTLGQGGVATKTPVQDATSAASTASAITQAKPVAGIPGLYSLELTITPQSGKDVPPSEQVTYDKMLNFFKLIENDRRTAQVTQVEIQPGVNGQSFSFTLVINIFIKP